MNLLDYSLFVRLPEQIKTIKSLQRYANIIGIVFLIIALPLSFFVLISGIGGNELIIYIFISLEVLAILAYIFITVFHAVKLKKFRSEGRAGDDAAEGAYCVVNSRLDEYTARRKKFITSFGIAAGGVVVVMAILLFIFNKATYATLVIIITVSAVVLAGLVITPVVLIMLAQYRLSTRCMGEFEIIQEYMEKQEPKEAVEQ